MFFGTVICEEIIFKDTGYEKNFCAHSCVFDGFCFICCLRRERRKEKEKSKNTESNADNDVLDESEVASDTESESATGSDTESSNESDSKTETDSNTNTEPAPVPVVYSEGLEFVENEAGNEYILKGIGSCYDKNVIIPKEFNGLPVTVIAENAFLDNARITSVTVPEGVKVIGNSAFSVCDALKSVVLPYSLKRIEDNAFYYSQKLADVTVGRA